MKKKTLLLLAFATCFSLVGCGPDTHESLSSESGDLFPVTPTYDVPSFQIHYLRNDVEYSPWCLWLWTEDKDGADYEFNGGDLKNGAIASYTFDDLGITEDGTLSFIVKKGRAGNWLSKDPDADRSIDFSSIEADENDVKHVYLKTGDNFVYTTPEYKMPDLVKSAYFADESLVITTFSTPVKKLTLKKGNEVIASESFEESEKKTLYRFTLDPLLIDYLATYTLEAEFVSGTIRTQELDKTRLYGTEGFKDLYHYDGDDLGVTFDGDIATFKVWSPFVDSISLRLYKSGTPRSLDSKKGDDAYTESPLTKGEKGVWSLTKPTSESFNSYYTYFVKSKAYPEGIEIVDPYARSAGINGLRGFIPDFSSKEATPEGWNDFKPAKLDRKELVVYETHIADLTSSSTWTKDAKARALEKTYAGAMLSGTVYNDGKKDYKTGFDHVASLGVNAVQILPIFDQANDERPEKRSFNWGYNPLNYNVPEGVYSSDPYDGYARIKELRSLIEAYGEKGMNVIMDVVYNHVNGAIGSNFDVLAPGYFFRYSEGKLTSASGCGNDTASENSMYSKFMIDSASYWAKEYKLGGFRFDLMGLHDLETMNTLVSKVKEVNPDIVIYGEPWDMTSLRDHKMANQTTIGSWEGFGGFNDKMRDALIKGGLSAASELGWATNPRGGSKADAMTIVSGIKGGLSTPDRNVSYVTCHDNYTLYDRAYMAGIHDEELLRKMPVLANSVALLSEGTSFMFSGEEMLRSKDTGKKDENGYAIKDENSHASSYEVNALDYSLLAKNEEVTDIYRKLIALKTGAEGLHLGDASSLVVSLSDDGHQISFDVIDGTKTYRIVHNDGASSHPSVDMSGFSLYLDTLNENTSLNANTASKPYQTLIGVKG